MIVVCIDGDVSDVRAAFALHCRLLEKREEIARSGDTECLLDMRFTGGLCDRARRAIDGFARWLQDRGARMIVLLWPRAAEA